MVFQLPSKEPLKRDSKPTVVPPFISTNGVHVNQSPQSTEKKNTHLPNTVVKHKNKLNDEKNMNESKILDDSTFTMRLVSKIENWSPSTAKYARLSIFGCKVSIFHFINQNYLFIFKCLFYFSICTKMF